MRLHAVTVVVCALFALGGQVLPDRPWPLAANETALRTSPAAPAGHCRDGGARSCCADGLLDR